PPALRSPGARRRCPPAGRSRSRPAPASSAGASASSACSGLLGFFDHHAVVTVVLAEPDGHALAPGGREVLADVVGANRQLAVAAVDQDRELDRPRPPEVDDGVEGSADGTAREEDVVHQDDGLVLDRERDVGPADDRRPHGQRGAVDLGDLGGEPLRERDATGAQADEREVGGAAVLLEDLVGNAGEGPVERRFVENLGFLSEARYGGGHLLSLRASRGSLKGKCTNYPHSTGGGPALSIRGSASDVRSF